MAYEPHGKVGQIWRRKRDGVKIRLVSVDETNADWRWERVDDPLARGVVFDWNLVNRYELEDDAGMTPLELAWIRWSAKEGTANATPRELFAAGYRANR